METNDSPDDLTTDAPPRRAAEGTPAGSATWARRGADRMGLPGGEAGSDSHRLGEPATADGADPDISPSLAGGHAGATHRNAQN